MKPSKTTPAADGGLSVGGRGAGRPLRADARRNRARLLDVADAVFSARGTSASTEEIAREAGVGVGTVFRHFPTKETLLEAVFIGRLQRLAEEAETLAEEAETLAEEAETLAEDDDPGAALFAFFSHVVEQASTKGALAEALAEAGIDFASNASPVKEGFRRALGELLARGQQAGAVREDVRLPDLLALLVGTARAGEQVGRDTAIRARTLAVVLDGLRPPGSR